MSFANTSESQELTNDSQARGYGAPNISKSQHNRSSGKKVIPNQRVKFFLEGHGTVVSWTGVIGQASECVLWQTVIKINFNTTAISLEKPSL